jgi:hypothetical protein
MIMSEKSVLKIVITSRNFMHATDVLGYLFPLILKLPVFKILSDLSLLRSKFWF